ncbi:hypothetical protein TCAL_02081 [Tigriopus californicus]|uniref:Death domain-containing protein n=1 Tax=Tigriopus californicus TaxID=6832 RepID=A0A553NCW3_TIGCA|nr:hypothetical protein TCAL_02081 [Tigriopus californicus]
MRICKVVLLAVGLFSFAFQAHCVELDNLCEEFLQVSNWEDIVALLENKMAIGDSDMLRIGRYLNSTDLQAIIDHMWEQQEFEQFYKWILDNGLNPQPFYDWIDDLIHIEINSTTNGASGIGEKIEDISLHLKMSRQDFVGRSLRSLYEEIKAIVPLHDILTWLIGHCIDDQDMIDLMDKLQERDTKKVMDHLYNSTEFQDLRCTLLEEGFKIREYEIGVCGFIGWGDCNYFEC